MRSALVAAAAIVAVQSTPALADKFIAVTPSGATEMLFAEKPQAAIGKLSSRCIDVRWTVISSSSNELVCESPLNTGESILGQMLMGNSYSTAPRRFFRFNAAEINGITRVQGSGWMELQMAFGQTKRTDFSGPPVHNGLMNFMAAAGGKFPIGTTFPNHAALGIQADNFQNGKLQYFRVKEVTPGSAAEKVGIRVGDVITGIAGKQFKNNDDYWDATARAGSKPTYEVSFLRDGKNMKVTVERAFRPTWTEAVVASTEQASAVATTAQSSVADELGKLLKLKEAGALTDEEFEAQKKKLLEQ
jgi:hypothetical protein